MKIVADENVPRSVVDALRAAGHDVVWALEADPGAPDARLLARAARARSLLVTLDKDLADRAARRGTPVVLVRARGAGSMALARLVASSLAARDDWLKHQAVIEPDRIRMRPLSSGLGRSVRGRRK